jgi:hypothetical protein
MVETVTAPVRLDPPFKEPMTDATGIVSPVWAAWFQVLIDRSAVGNFGVARTGSITSDGSSGVSGTFDPPFTRAPMISLYDPFGTLVALTGIVADAVGFTGTAPLPGTVYTWVAVG